MNHYRVRPCAWCELWARPSRCATNSASRWRSRWRRATKRAARSPPRITNRASKVSEDAWNRNEHSIILMEFSSLTALEVVKWQLPVQSVMKISLKRRKCFHFIMNKPGCSIYQIVIHTRHHSGITCPIFMWTQMNCSLARMLVSKLKKFRKLLPLFLNRFYTSILTI